MLAILAPLFEQVKISMNLTQLDDFNKAVLANPALLNKYALNTHPYYMAKALRRIHEGMIQVNREKNDAVTFVDVIEKIKPSSNNKELWVAIICAFVEKGFPFSSLPSELQTIEVLTKFNSFYYEYWYTSNTLGERIASGAYLELSPELRAKNEFRQFILLHNEQSTERSMITTGDDEEDEEKLKYIQKVFSLNQPEFNGFKKAAPRNIYLYQLFGIDYAEILKDSVIKRADYCIGHYKSTERKKFLVWQAKTYCDTIIL